MCTMSITEFEAWDKTLKFAAMPSLRTKRRLVSRLCPETIAHFETAIQPCTGRSKLRPDLSNAKKSLKSLSAGVCRNLIRLGPLPVSV